MRVLLLTDGIYPIVMGGMQKHSYYLAKFLSNKGIDLLVVHCTPDGDSIAEKELPEFQDFDLSRVQFIQREFPGGEDHFPGHYVRANKRYSTQIFEQLKEQLDQFDLIYCQGFTGWEFVQQAQAGRLNVPIAVNLHGYEMFQKAPSLQVKLSHYLLRGIAKKISIHADIVFSFGGMISEILGDMGVEEAKIIESPIGIESSWIKEGNLSMTNNPRKFVFVGRNERRKGIKELSEAIRQLIHEGRHKFEFHFIGDIAIEGRINAPQVIYHGKIVEEEKIQHILHASDVLVCPSYAEGMPTVIMEAMASGLAIMGTNVGAISKQIEQNGYLIEDAQVLKVKEALEAVIGLDEETLLRWKENSRRKVKNEFLWDKVIEHKIACFEKAIESYKHKVLY